MGGGGWGRIVWLMEGFVCVCVKEPSITRPKVKFKFSGDEAL